MSMFFLSDKLFITGSSHNSIIDFGIKYAANIVKNIQYILEIREEFVFQ